MTDYGLPSPRAVQKQSQNLVPQRVPQLSDPKGMRKPWRYISIIMQKIWDHIKTMPTLNLLGRLQAQDSCFIRHPGRGRRVRAHWGSRRTSSEKSPALVPRFWGQVQRWVFQGRWNTLPYVDMSIFVSYGFHLKGTECRWRTSQVPVKEWYKKLTMWFNKIRKSSSLAVTL